ncbi:MAG: hypothetical protein AAF458_04775 [Pseudomonadota bacterium]
MIDTSRPVRVFRNWKRGCYSIMQDGLVRASASAVRLDDVELLVRPSGRARMLKTGRKNVHAYAIGILIDFVSVDERRELGEFEGRALFYDAHRFDAFVDRDDHTPLGWADQVQLDPTGAFYSVIEPAPLPLAEAA